MKRAVIAGVVVPIVAVVGASSWVFARAPAAVDPVPRTIPYQGILEQAGQAVNGAVSMHFALYSAPGNGATETTNRVWDDTFNVDVVQGRFFVNLGAGARPLALESLDSAPLYIGVSIVPTAGAEVSLSGRQILGAAPFAMRASEAHGAVGALDARLSQKRVISYAGKTYSTEAVYCGATSPTSGRVTEGAAVGRPAAKAKCEAACSSPSAHMCKAAELVVTEELGISHVEGWYSTEAYVLMPQDKPIDDCAGWVTADSTYLGPYANSAPTYQSCNGVTPILCCD